MNPTTPNKKFPSSCRQIETDRERDIYKIDRQRETKRERHRDRQRRTETNCQRQRHHSLA